MDGFDEYLWMDKYQPKTLENLSFNHTITKILDSLSKKDDFPHLIFYGPEGAGKKTRIHAFLEKVYGPGVHKINTEVRELKINSTTIEFNITSSNYHIELCPSESANHDKVIVQKVIKETSSTGQLDAKSQKNFKVIVLLEVDNLSRDAQAALRRTMEKYSKNCRLIMSCNSLTKIIPPIRSRCLGLRVASPNEAELKNLLKEISNNEAIKLSDQILDDIIKESDCNIRKAINTLQLTSLESYSKKIFIPEYVSAIQSICYEIKKEQSPNALKRLRQNILKLIVNGIESEGIILGVTKEMLKIEKNELKQKEIIRWGAIFDERAQNGTKAIFHIEALIARIMLILSQ